MFDHSNLRKDLMMRFRSFKFNNSSLRRTISFIYFSFFGLRTLFYLTQQCIYVARHTILKNASYSGDNIISNDPLRNLMISTGVVYRRQGTAGIYYYSVLLSGVIVFCLPGWFPGKQVYDYLNDKNFIRFLKSPDVEYERISRRIDFHLKHIRNSNIEFTRKIMEESFFYGDVNPGILEAIVGNNCTKDTKRFPCFTAKDTFLYNLSYQSEYLSELSLRKGKIWPPNRSPDWAQAIKHFWVVLDRFTSVFFWIIGQGFCLYTGRFAYLALNEFSGTKKLSWIDRITLADTHVAVHVLITCYLVSNIVTITAVRDQLFSVKMFEFRMIRISKALRKINSEYDRKINSNVKLDQKSLSHLRQNESIAQLDCDREAIEVYISFRMFSDDIKSSLNLARRSIEMNVIFIILSLTLTLALSDATFHTNRLIVLGLYLMSVSINSAFFMLAALHASCINMTKLIWTFIACAERYTLDKNLSELNHSDDHRKSSDTLKTSPSFLENSYIDIDFSYFNHSPINAHTLLLWRRLLENYDHLKEEFVCKVFGLYKIDYDCVLSVNYWLTSISLFLLSNRGWFK